MAERIIWPHEDVIHGFWVQPRSILAGEYPGAVDPDRTLEKIDTLLDAGMATFIDLTTPADGLQPYEPLLLAAGERHGMDVARIAHPIPDMGVLPVGAYDEILASVHAGSERGGVYIHCWGGVGRTGTVVGCLFVEQGLSYEGAMRTLKERREYTSKADRRAPETYAQREIIAQRAAARAGR